MFDRAFRIATLSGIPVKIHWTFLFFFVWIIYLGQKMGMDVPGIARLGAFAMVLFACVVLHELGHSLCAARYGVRTLDIIITPIGGIARLLRIPAKPVQELAVALAGPAVNVVIAILLFALLTFFGPQGVELVGDPDRIFERPSNFLPSLFWINLALIVFNLIPAFPMDGGRVLRALLAMKLSRQRATLWAARVGQILAVGFVAFGLWKGDYILAFIGLFVFGSAANEYRMVKIEQRLQDGNVADIVRGKFTSFNLNDRMEKAIIELKKGKEHDFVITDEFGQVIGVLHEEFINEAEKDQQQELTVAYFLSPQFERIPQTLNLKQLLQKFQHNGYSIMPVYQSDQMIGVVDRKAITKFVKSTPRLWTAK